jgi:thioesterase domain-containing protein/acyl carrier protein
VWQELLGIEQVTTEDHFFAIGGDSLLAVRLCLRIESLFGVELSPAVLFPDDRLGALATTIATHHMAPSAVLVPIRPGGSRRPLFLAHSVGGEVLSYLRLVQHLDPEVPVYGLQGQPLNHSPDRPLQIEAMASEYIAAIRSTQQDGPYQLAGYSAGGVVAFEIARQLQAAGHEVSLLGIIDGDAPASAYARGSSRIRFAGRFVRNVGFWIVDDLLRSTQQDLSTRVRSKIRLVRNRFGGVRSLRSTPDIRDVLGVPGMTDRHVPWLVAFARALSTYQPTPYPGKVTLLRARTFGLFESMKLDRGWGPLAGSGVDVTVVKGDHVSILHEPHVAGLALELEKTLSFGGRADSSPAGNGAALREGTRPRTIPRRPAALPP